MLNDFSYLFPVVIAGTAMIMDLRTAKADNGWILFSMFVGFVFCIRERGVSGIRFFLMGSGAPLFLAVLFVFGMLGAGDIKLFCALGSVMGFSEILKCICISFMIGACISSAILISEHNFCERIRYFMSYLENTVKNKQILSYGKKDISLPENFHFTVPIFLSVLLYAGGIY